MTLPVNLRVNVGAPFPSRVSGASFIVVSKANGVWNIAPDYTKLANIPPTQTQEFVVYDPVTGAYGLLNVSTFITSNAGSYRLVSASGDVTITQFDVIILLDKTVGAATNVNLPLSGSRSGVPVTVKDLKGDANTNNITFVPALSETIDGFSAAAAAANGVALIDANYGSKTLYPLTSGGWYLK